MALVGSFTAYAVYRMSAAHSDQNSRRRVFAAAVAGYVAINASALVTAIELGIQPTLFRDVSGTPLYAPYPLHVAIPAMMIGHLTFAGLAEAAISAGMVSYLQRADIGLLQGVRSLAQTPGRTKADVSAASAVRRLWWAVAVLMLLTPLGILAAGTAWGEWSAAGLTNPQTQGQIGSAPENHALPSSVPPGIKKLSALWTAPFPGYAPRFIKSPRFGYLLSSMFGVGFFVLASLVARQVGRKWSKRNLRS